MTMFQCPLLLLLPHALEPLPRAAELAAGQEPEGRIASACGGLAVLVLLLTVDVGVILVFICCAGR